MSIPITARIFEIAESEQQQNHHFPNGIKKSQQKSYKTRAHIVQVNKKVQKNEARKRSLTKSHFNKRNSGTHKRNHFYKRKLCKDTKQKAAKKTQTTNSFNGNDVASTQKKRYSVHLELTSVPRFGDAAFYRHSFPHTSSAKVSSLLKV